MENDNFSIPKKIPKKIFIVPYRNRPQHKFFFCKHMIFLLEDEDNNDYEIYFSQQSDLRSFNRGATKNIGFLAMKEKYPDHYKNITFIFNDIDTMPFYKLFDYNTHIGCVKHYYGFEHSLGGIVVIKGYDFEKINGYPCYWGWGKEDQALQKRCNQHGITIDRSHFYKIGSPNILHLFDGVSRIITNNENVIYCNNNNDGLNAISRLEYKIEDDSTNSDDNIFVVNNKNIHYINIKNFECYTEYESSKFYTYDLRENTQNFVYPDKFKEITKKIHNNSQNVVLNNDWTNIPNLESENDKNIKLYNTFIKNKQNVPIELINKINNHVFKETSENNSLTYKYSANYAIVNNIKTRATASAKIRLGGLYR